MTPNLKAEMARHDVAHETLGAVIGKSPKTVWNKLNGQSIFTCDEMFEIKFKLFPQYSLDYLFSSEIQENKKEEAS